jgi:peroxiredoxin-like protein|tara:strand:- start:830 stop:1270 length:441 start_codon:yes stop_codon:yes gene_type:complete
MSALPHQYKVTVAGKPDNKLLAQANHLPDLQVAAPVGFGGPGDQWSPEELLMAALANCLILSFRAITKASKFDWVSIECESNGTLDQVDHKIQFTQVTTKAKLFIASADDMEKAKKLLHKAEDVCFISNSLSCTSHFESDVVVVSE